MPLSLTFMILGVVYVTMLHNQNCQIYTLTTHTKHILISKFKIKKELQIFYHLQLKFWMDSNIQIVMPRCASSPRWNFRNMTLRVLLVFEWKVPHSTWAYQSWTISVFILLTVRFLNWYRQKYCLILLLSEVIVLNTEWLWQLKFFN